MCNKKNGFWKFLLICGAVAAAIYAVTVLLRKMNENRCIAEADCSDDEEDCCDSCDICASENSEEEEAAE